MSRSCRHRETTPRPEDAELDLRPIERVIIPCDCERCGAEDVTERVYVRSDKSQF